jgi:hypothetical protein
VLVLETVGAPVGRRQRRPRKRPRPQPAESGAEPDSVEIFRLTVIFADRPFAGEPDAAGWLAGLEGDEEALDSEVDAGLRVVNRALHAQRAAAQDAFVADVSPSGALGVRVGYGAGDALAEGEFTQAVEVSPSAQRQRRVDALRPQERVARALGGHEQVPLHESHLLRARADLDCGRLREAAIELRAGIEALLADPTGRSSSEDEASDLAALSEQGPGLTAAARAALQAEPEPEPLSEALLIAERVVRRRRILG